MRTATDFSDRGINSTFSTMVAALGNVQTADADDVSAARETRVGSIAAAHKTYANPLFTATSGYVTANRGESPRNAAKKMAEVHGNRTHRPCG